MTPRCFGTAMAALLLAHTTIAAPPGLRVHSSQRLLESTTGEPFFWMGDTAWDLHHLDPSEVDTYMSTRAAQGFNIIQGPNMHGSDENWAGETFGTPGAPNEAWFEHIDYIVQSAAAHDLRMALVLSWGSRHDLFTSETAYSYGAYVAERYCDDDHVAVLYIAGEFNWPEENLDIWTQMTQGIVDTCPDKLIAAHPRWFGGYEFQTTSHALHDLPGFSFNAIQSSLYGNCTNDPEHDRYLGTHNWLLVENDYAITPTKPVFDAEATYEMINAGHLSCKFPTVRWDAFGVRRRAYWSVFAGGFGHTYGANGVFQFHQSDWPQTQFAPLHTWDVAIHYEGATQMGLMRLLMESRPFADRIPAQDRFVSDPMITVPDHQHATRDASGRWMMVYIPESNRTVTMDVSVMSGSTLDLWWFDPRDGTTSLFDTVNIDDLPNGELSATTPGGEDWVLVIDDAAQGFPEPGGVLEPFDPDVNGDGLVTVDDLLIILSSWGTCGGCAADINGDGQVSVPDLLLVLAAM